MTGSREIQPAKIALFGSGETAPAGRRVHEMLFQELEAPIQVAIPETPAGFQPNSDYVAGRLAEFITQKLQNFHPQVTVVPVRRRDGPNSTNDRALIEPLLTADYIFAGPGSPSYAVRHLEETLTWHTILARQRRGAILALASATAIAASAHALPVYEIFKVGDDLHWLPGLDLLGPYGLELAIVTHWNNQEGGAHLDTSRCFMGTERMARLETMLPPSTTVLGIDEHTAIVLDLVEGTARVIGQGGITIRHAGEERRFADGQTLDLDTLGTVRLPTLDEGLDAKAVETVLEAEKTAASLPADVAEMIEKREQARQAKDWAQADAIRERLAQRGYIIEDTPQGPRWQKNVAS